MQVKQFLLVDDDDITNFIHQALLSELSATTQVDVAHNGVEAINFIQHSWKHSKQEIYCKVVLLDINMPVMNGFEFLDHFYRLGNYHDVSIALLSSSQNDQDKRKAAQYPIVDYIEKPLDQEKLSKLMAKL